MGRSPSCFDDNKNLIKKGPWTPEEDEKLIDCINRHGHGSWRSLPKLAGLNRCGKSCRLRWTNYLRPDIKRGKFSQEEERMIINLHSLLGNKWSRIASHFPERTDNEIKNFWNTHIRKKLLQMGIDPQTHQPRTDFNYLSNLNQLLTFPQFGNPSDLQADATTQIAKFQLLQNIMQFIINGSNPIIPNNIHQAGLLGPQNHNIIIGQAQNIPREILSHIQNIPGRNSDNQSLAISASWEGGFTDNSSTYNLYDGVQMENYQFPGLVCDETPTLNKMDSGSKASIASTQCVDANSPTDSSIFEDWEKLIMDEDSGSYWKDILEHTSSSSSPICGKEW